LSVLHAQPLIDERISTAGVIRERMISEALTPASRRSAMPDQDEQQNNPEDKTPAIDPRSFGLTKVAYSVRETIDIISLNRTSLYEAINRGELHPVKWNRKTLLLAPDLAAFLAKLKKMN
jgi:hypothetical protein